jgi:hypothetical protein
MQGHERKVVAGRDICPIALANAKGTPSKFGLDCRFALMIEQIP